MAKLQEYRHKRDFGVTPEPSGAEESAHAGLAFVIQKHAASHLHWDFRIELDGVLLSWAVPKGPSLDTADKRLAMRVEDHPIAYGSFEGVIPKGEYGGGTVMLWDRGTWEPDHGDPRQHLAEGHLKFYLYGERLRGRWMLVRSKGYGGSRGKESWLLFKERDEEARPKSEFDAVSEWMTSVATGRTMDEIASDVEAVWHSNESVEANVAASAGLQPPPSGPVLSALDAADANKARRGPMPKGVDVELATLVKEIPEGERWLHEIKFDGYRILAFLEDGRVRLMSRNGNDWTTRFKTVAAAVAALSPEQAILDGEVVVMKPDGTNDFQALQNFARRGEDAELHYMVFDLLYLNGYDLRDSPLSERKRLLQSLIPRHADIIRYTDHIEGRGDAFFKSACDLALEGVVSKRRDAPYRSGRTKDWLKTKCLLRQEFVVVGWTDPGGSRQAFGSLVIGVHEDGQLKQVGRVGTGFDDQSLRDIHARLGDLSRETPAVINPPAGAAGRGIHWVEPHLVTEVAFAEWTEDEQLRHPSFLGLREDKPAEDVVVEEPSPTPPPPSEEAPGHDDEPVVDGVRLSNPDRVLWPDVGVTKLELARYYESVAHLMLPHVAERPLALVRCPTGYTGECFYQKRVENFPPAVATVPIDDDGEHVPYARITGLPSIIGLVQMGVLEIHPWGSKADDTEKPDRLIFDLDPDPDLPWVTITATARLIHAELDRLGLKSWVKTTGGKGLHIVVPVTRRQGWTDARDFTKAFVESIVRMEPRLFTSSMSKSQRDGRIFIDYVRNTRGSTAVAAYGSRARPGAPVSAPLFWTELESMQERPEYTVRNLGARIASLPSDPWADLVHERQGITKPMRARLGLD